MKLFLFVLLGFAMLFLLGLYIGRKQRDNTGIIQPAAPEDTTRKTTRLERTQEIIIVSIGVVALLALALSPFLVSIGGAAKVGAITTETDLYQAASTIGQIIGWGAIGLVFLLITVCIISMAWMAHKGNR